MQNNTLNSANVQKTAFRELMKGVATCIPGHVLALLENGAKQRAQVQIGIQRIDINGAVFNPPPIIDVPICFIGDDYVVEYQINAGCEGMIFFSQRCVDGWKNTGGIADNPLGRFHSLQDAFFIPGFRSLANVLPDFQNNGIRMRNKSGNQFAWLKNDGSIAVENSAGHIRISPDGVVTINGVTFQTNGDVESPTEIKSNTMTATTNGTFGGKSMIDHVHIGVEAGPSNTGVPL